MGGLSHEYLLRLKRAMKLIKSLAVAGNAFADWLD